MLNCIKSRKDVCSWRKGDEAETAGKIKWYAQKLKELGECESE